MTLRGERCLVRVWSGRDLEALVRQANDHEIARQLRDRFPHPYTRADGRAFLAGAGSGEGPPCNFAIEVDGRVAGGIGYSRGSDVERYSAEIGYWLGRAHWGRGIATDAVRVVVRHLFDEMNLLRLYAVPLADNAASIRVLEKAEFVREAVLRCGCVKYGEPRDQLLYARVNGTWTGARA